MVNKTFDLTDESNHLSIKIRSKGKDGIEQIVTIDAVKILSDMKIYIESNDKENVTVNTSGLPTIKA